MKHEACVAPSHSLLLVMDESIGVVPDTMGGAVVAATPSCVAIGTRSEQDGETTVTISDDSGSVSGVLVFDGNVASPNYQVVVCTVLGVVLLRLDTAGPVARVRVWVNDDVEPDVVEVVVTSPQSLYA